MHLFRPGLVHKPHNFLRCSPPHNAVVDEDDTIAANNAGSCRMLQFDAERAYALLWLYECAADVVIADDAKLKWNISFLSKSNGRRHP